MIALCVRVGGGRGLSAMASLDLDVAAWAVQSGRTLAPTWLENTNDSLAIA